MSKLDIIIPVYNEGTGIRNVIDDAAAKISTPHNLLIVYDFEEDTTLPVVRQYESKFHNLKLIKNKYGLGYINAIKTGLEAAQAEVMVIVTSDSADDLSIIDQMYERIDAGYDIVCGSRYMRGGGQEGGSLLKKMLSRLAGVSLYYLVGFPTHDVTNSFKMYSKKALQEISIESTGGFELSIEIIVKAFARGAKITEVPYTWRDRNIGNSKFKLWKWLPKYLYWYWFALRNRLACPLSRVSL